MLIALESFSLASTHFGALVLWMLVESTMNGNGEVGDGKMRSQKSFLQQSLFMTLEQFLAQAQHNPQNAVRVAVNHCAEDEGSRELFEPVAYRPTDQPARDQFRNDPIRRVEHNYNYSSCLFPKMQFVIK